jgi:shikimate kinase
MTNRIHIIGAAGCGKTTLGQALSSQLGCAFFDADDFFWKPTVPPYQEQRGREDRRALVLETLSQHDKWVLSGGICGWGMELAQAPDMVVFLSVAKDLRLQRLVEREQRKLGRVDPEFIAWAGQYDDGGPDMQSRAMHEQWLAGLRGPVIRRSGAGPVAELVGEVMGF